MFDEYIRFHARRRPDAPAVVIGDREIGYACFDADIDRVAAALRPQAERRTVAVAVEEEYLRWLVVLALARLGIASTPPGDPDASLTVSDRAAHGGSTLHLTQEILAGPPAEVAPVRGERDSLARILHTSGTTGERKRIALSWRAIDISIRNVPVVYGAPKGRWLPVTGIGTVLGISMTLAGWATGNAVILGAGGLLTPDLLGLDPVLLALAPDQLRRLLDKLPDGFAPLRGMRLISGGGAVPPALARAARGRLTPDLVSVYGTSECGAAAIADGALLERQEGAAGYVVPGTRVEIVDLDDHPVPAGEQGRVRIRNDRVVAGYLDDPARSATMFRDGWFYPGDLGRLLPDGLLLIDGRVDDLMNFAGHKILPAAIEATVLEAPGVAEVAVFAVPDESGLARCWLAIVRGDGFDAGALATALGRRLVQLGAVRWITLDALPRNAMGKVQRDRLRAVVAKLQEEGKVPGG